jgi:hypothetical protein
MLLSSALGGNCRTCVVVTGSSEKQHAIETMQSMRFGESCTLVTRDTSGDNMAAVTRAIRQVGCTSQSSIFVVATACDLGCPLLKPT